MKKIYNYNVNFYGNEKKYINRCISSTWISTNGNFVNQFESKISKLENFKYAVATNSGTSALHLALIIEGVCLTDEVIVPTITFVSTVNVILYCNASPIFMDCTDDFIIDELKTIHFILNKTKFNGKFSINCKTKKIIKAIFIVNVWGVKKELKDLEKICKSRNIKIIIDAAESFGSKFFIKNSNKNIKYTSCYSFNANKVITTGAGGAILTNSSKIKQKAFYLSTQAKKDPLFFIHDNLGYNYRMSNLHAAIGLGQIEKSEKILKKKKEISLIYNKYLSNMNNVVFNYKDISLINSSNCWMNVITFKNSNFNLKKFIYFMKKKKIFIKPVWKLNHLQKFLNSYEKYKIKNAYRLVKNSCCLPSSNDLTLKEIKYICRSIMNFNLKL
jgi:perosamine synthetase